MWWAAIEDGHGMVLMRCPCSPGREQDSLFPDRVNPGAPPSTPVPVGGVNMKVLVIQNFEVEGLGLHEEYLLEKAIDTDTIHPWRGDPFPDSGVYDLVMVGGTPVCIGELDQHGFLVREREYLRARIAGGGACFGICFGAQLLASVLGADVKKNPVMEIGGYQVRLSQEGASDPVLTGFPREFPVFHWHGDTFDIPDGAAHLVEGDDCPNQMFRAGNVIGAQFHVEITTPIATRWTVEYAHELEKVGKSADHVIDECQSREHTMQELSLRMMDNLITLIA